ncbi:MAG: hypothetical protein ACTSYK_05700, partial [Alphaproteobacteria bacterium]
MLLGDEHAEKTLIADELPDVLRNVVKIMADAPFVEALEAGTTGWDAELFSGTPDFNKLRRVAPIALTAEERG